MWCPFAFCLKIAKTIIFGRSTVQTRRSACSTGTALQDERVLYTEEKSLHMRTSIRALALAAVVTIPVLPALAAKPTTKPTRPACKPIPAAGVAYVVRGTLTADATATSISFKVTGGNAFGKRATKTSPAEGISVAIGTCTKITRVTIVNRQRIQGWANLKSGDKVLLTWRAKRGTAVEALGAPRRIVELRKAVAKPAPVVTPPPAVPTTPVVTTPAS
jgi:hypothetical protein